MSFDDRIRQQYTGEAGHRYHDREKERPPRFRKEHMGFGNPFAPIKETSEVSFPWIGRPRARKIAPYVTDASVVLEYGVGTGWNLSQLNCRRRIGYDLSEHLEPLLKRSGIEFVKTIDAVADESIDAVICHHVLEHTAHPPETLKEIWRPLREGGSLLLFVPHETGMGFRRFDPDDPNQHLYSWSVQSLGNLVTGLGYTVTTARVQRFGYDRFAAVWANRLRIGEWGFRLIRGMIHLIRPGSEVFILGVKPRSG